MKKKDYQKAALAWLAMAAAAIFFGIARETWLPVLAGGRSRCLATALVMGSVFYIAFVFLEKGGRRLAAKELWLVGTCWLAATIIFEFGFGHFVMGHPWSELLADYNILEGRWWPLVLVEILVAPAGIKKWLFK